jgi:dienelactone hydrolase
MRARSRTSWSGNVAQASGSRSASTPSTAARIVADHGAGIEHDIEIYPGVGHGFMNDHEPAELPLWVRVIARLTNARYDELATRDAQRRIISFFRTHLAEGQPQ